MRTTREPPKMNRFRLKQSHFIWSLLIAGLIAPFVFSAYVIDDVLIKALIFALLAVSLDLAWGYAGILSLGHGTFFGLAAYIMGVLLVKFSAPSIHILAPVLGILGPTLLALLLGMLLFYTKTSELYIAIVTLSLSTLAPQLILRIPQWTGGMTGLSGIPLFPFDLKVKYYLIFGLAVLVTYAVNRIVRSDFGRLITAVRDNEQRIRFLGFNTSFVKLIAFTLSGMIAGIAGVLFPPQNGFISQTLPGFATSALVIVWVAIGGRGTLVGPFLGTILINWISPYLNAHFPYLWQLFLGAIFILVIMFFPGGLYSLITRYFKSTENYKLFGKATDQVEGNSHHLVIRGLDVSYGSLKVIRGLDFEMVSHKLQCLIGPNGAGKSTLVNAISGNVWPNSGEILFNDRVIQNKRPDWIGKIGLGRTFQTANLFDSLTVAENLFLATCKGKLPSMIHRTEEFHIPELVLRMLSISGLSNKLPEIVKSLGHGERKWLELFMVLCTEPRMILLDEPTAGLTTQERNAVGSILQELVRTEGIGLLLIEHDMDFVKAIADQISVLVDGRIVANGSVEEVVANNIVREFYMGERVT